MASHGSTEAVMMAAQEPDIYLTNAEMRMNKNAPTACMRISSTVLEPAKCYSKAGISTVKMFEYSKGDQPRPQSAQSLQAYAAMFDKYYGGDSMIDRLVAHHQAASSTSSAATISRSKQRPASASAAVGDRSVPIKRSSNKANASQLKDLTADEAARLDREIELRAGRSARAKYLTPYLATKYSIAMEGMGPNAVLNPARQGLTMVPTGGMPKELALTHADAQGAAKVMELAATLQEAEKQRAAKAAEARKRNIVVAAARPPPPRPASASFKSTTREQAQKASARTASGTAAAHMGPGQYDFDRYHMYMKPNVLTPKLEPRVAAGPIEGDVTAEHSTSGQGAAATQQPPSQSQQRPASGATGQQKDATTSGRPASAPTLAIFKDAHRVHPAKPTPKGSSSFKAPPRPYIDAQSTAGHLACTYFREDYDDFKKKSPKLVTKFEAQVARPPMVVAADTPPALGPGVYLHGASMPVSRTGAHVNAGHAHTRYALEFGRQVARPGSAPPVRTEASALQPPVSAAQGAEALLAMYGPAGADLDPSTLVSIRALEAAAEAGPGGYRSSPYPSAKGRPASAAPASTAAAPVVAAGAGVQGVPTVLGHEELQKYSSTGLAKRVPGGRMSLTTRAAETMGMRAMSRDGVIPPASGPLRMGAGADVTYEPDDSKQSHRSRPPSWKLPPNRYEQSQAWVSAAALAFVQQQ